MPPVSFQKTSCMYPPPIIRYSKMSETELWEVAKANAMFDANSASFEGLDLNQEKLEKAYFEDLKLGTAIYKEIELHGNLQKAIDTVLQGNPVSPEKMQIFEAYKEIANHVKT